ncbi:hypothetical protein B0H14DRAFT_715008 [Mycena olivaceomarginata]|nr:hypothetical protein B0H14DRAFT_715008 [Mycena olivaceomarginata]
MSGSELSLCHLPDLSDASFSFQIPTDSPDNLLHADTHDFFAAGDDLLGSPIRSNEAPLTLDDLTPRPRAIPAVSSPRAHTANKSLLPTPKFNLHPPTTSRVPKPASTSHNRPKPKPAFGVLSRVKEVSGAPKEQPVRGSNGVPPNAVAPPASVALSKPAVHARTKSTVISSEKSTAAGEERLNTAEVVSATVPDSPAKPNIHVDEPAPSPPPSATVNNAVAAEQTAHPVESITPAATVPAAKPESKSKKKIIASSGIAKTEATAPATSRPRPAIPPPKMTAGFKSVSKKPRPVVRAQSHLDSVGGGPVVGAMDMGIAARLVMYEEQLTAMGSFPASDNDDAMGTGTDPAVRDAAVQDDAWGGEIPDVRDSLGDMHDEMRDNALSVNNPAGSNVVPAADPMEEHAEEEPITVSAGVELDLAPRAESRDPLMYGAPRLSQQSPRKVGLYGGGELEGETGR